MKGKLLSTLKFQTRSIPPRNTMITILVQRTQWSSRARGSVYMPSIVRGLCITTTRHDLWQCCSTGFIDRCDLPLSRGILTVATKRLRGPRSSVTNSVNAPVSFRRKLQKSSHWSRTLSTLVTALQIAQVYRTRSNLDFSSVTQSWRRFPYGSILPLLPSI